jgi:hypothetical protein
MRAREARIPAPARPGLAEAARRVVALYESWAIASRGRIDSGLTNEPRRIGAG